MRYLKLSEIINIYEGITNQSGGLKGLRDENGLKSAIMNPLMKFGGKDLYPELFSKAAILCYSLINNHPFLDGNKRIGHAAMEIFLILNGYEINASVDDQEQIILKVAAGELNHGELTNWLKQNTIQRS